MTQRNPSPARRGHSKDPAEQTVANRAAELDRRSFLKFVGAGATAMFGAVHLGTLSGCSTATPSTAGTPWVSGDGQPKWLPPAYPTPLPGDPAGDDARRLAHYVVRDELLLPEGFRYDVLASWGDVLGPADQPQRQIIVGSNNDYTGLVAIPDRPREFWMIVNHEYVSPRPWLQGYREVRGGELPRLSVHADPDPAYARWGRLRIGDWLADGPSVRLGPRASEVEIPQQVREQIEQISEAGLADMGISILHVRRLKGGRFEVVREAADHRRITGNGRANIDLADPFAHTGPAAALLDAPPPGTISNCSGGTTPWGTFLTCEENIQYYVDAEVTADGQLLPERRMTFAGYGESSKGLLVTEVAEPVSLNGFGHGCKEPLDGRLYGWVCEIDPATGAMKKHTALGRVRHENVTLRCRTGERLAAYMGDDRRGGHIWKYVSDQVVANPTDPANSQLLERGTLYVARFEADYSGRWIALEAATPLAVPEPEQCATGFMKLPARPDGGYVTVGDTARERTTLEVADWLATIEQFTGKPFAECTLGDLVKPPANNSEENWRLEQGILLLDAFAMANAVGGTPTARPEDLEVHPYDHSVYIAFTDATDGGDGSPDGRIFPDSARQNSRQYGAVFRLEEAGSDPQAERFAWGRFVTSGEVAEQGGGFANADNLVFDRAGNLWMVTDISTTALNIPTSREDDDRTLPGAKLFPGVFGNNAMFMLPTAGPATGMPHCFAIGPMDCELCGPTFTEDGEALILSVQHPGEQKGIRTADRADQEHRHIIHDRADQPFDQQRTVPVGSNFPSDELGRPPRSSVVCITRRR